MGRNKNLNKAKKEKSDEFYTLYKDIADEISAYTEHNPDVFRGKTVLLPCDNPDHSNFTKYFTFLFDRFGLKKLISTYHNKNGNSFKWIFDGREAIKTPLNSDGDFRSEEITTLRDESDFIITNPPFSLLKEFIVWVAESDKKFIIVGNINAITYKDAFPLLRDGKMWLGKGGNISLLFSIPDEYHAPENMIVDGQKYATMSSICWFTNVEHGVRNKFLPLLTMEENLQSNNKISKIGYRRYDNYDAIEVPFTDAIPSDYDGIMGVPVSFMDKYNPEQFEIVGSNRGVNQEPTGVYGKSSYIDGKETYKRIFIRGRNAEK